MKETLEQRLIELETKLAFQDDAISKLSQELAQQIQVIDRQRVQIEYLARKLKGIEPSNIARESEETPPPHY